MKNEVVLDTKYGDVTGDGIYDMVSLTGNYLNEGESLAIENLKILIRDGASNFQQEILIPNVIGYQPIIYLYPFRNKNINDIYVSILSGGSGGYAYYYIFGYNGKKFILEFDADKFNNLFKSQVKYIDNYKVEIINTLNKKYLLDISDRDKDYLDEIYNSDGTLTKPISGDVSALNQLIPVDMDNDGIFNLLAFQRLTGLYNADSLGYLETVLSWQNNQFNIFANEQFLAQEAMEAERAK